MNIIMILTYFYYYRMIYILAYRIIGYPSFRGGGGWMILEICEMTYNNCNNVHYFMLFFFFFIIINYYIL